MLKKKFDWKEISWKNIFPKVSKDNSDLVCTDRLCGTDASSV